jgi:hypothetical protein
MFEKLKTIYSELTIDDFHPLRGTILLQNDGEGAYIKEWNHPTLARPTDDALGITSPADKGQPA